ncbi:bifunctional transaldolase/phosoglucose isomerase [Hymenobacter lutimineralis]|uniref:Transaldolase n=1 Tax=Hymenobacter lutimineralis TaxID=2606448 RepID=A0A5D6VGF4_9BACT|nr:bifunctional transaldolase/phosoglucose isomerase [Hymenobacter lutimineralis]TYZ14202.1 bifunctional transaldolase/phosoglucose isomerase [Hymenobacter lutimineralis]
MNPLASVRQFNQSIWLDYIRRNILVNGELARLLTEDGLRGVTSNPAIFEKAIGGSADYDAAIQALAQQGLGAEAIYEQLAVQDVQHACDLLRPLYDAPDSGGDGYVSLEVSPTLIHDTEGTVAEGLRFWHAVARPNVMIKVPATLEGLPAIHQLIAQGVNVNVTLIFGLERYQAVAEAYLLGLEDRAAAGLPLARIDSVASFFLSRIDVLLDPQLEQLAQQGGEQGATAAAAVGEVALASAKQAYQLYKDIFSGSRWEALRAQGAAPQRLLWASTGNKNPKYDNLKYVEHLIGPETVNTIPVETLDLYRAGGQPQSRLEEGTAEAAAVLASLPALGIDLTQVAQQLEDEGGQKFKEPFAKLLAVLEAKRQQAVDAAVVPAELHLGQYQAEVDASVAAFDAQNFTTGFWNKQGDLWVEDATAQQSVRSFMGWLRVAETMVGAVPEIEQFVHEVKAAGFKHVVVMGMGGSSMTPIVFKQAFASQANGLPMSVLDTTNPGSVREIEEAVPLAETLFVVASKSGTTAEPLAFGDYFYARMKELKGERAGENFVAITDPGSKFVTQATAEGYRRIFLNFPEVGGRFSALSYFGLVPAALYGLPIDEILAGAIGMMRACGAYGPVAHNPGLELGVALGVLAQHGRDKLTLVVPDSLSDLGLWLEQLIAESTGKEGKGILPLAGEPLTSISSYGTDRVFVYVGYQGQPDAVNEQHLAALEAAGHPIVRILMNDARDLGAEFFRWEVATAVSSAVLRINPFDQPNVQAAKTATDQLMKVVVEQGQLPQTSQPIVQENGTDYYTAAPGRNAEEVLKSFFGQANAGDFLCIQAYLMETPALNEELQQVRALVQEQLHIATASGYGPRFLHSTGQYHKGGPDTGLYLQLTTDHAQDLPLPGRPYTFGTFQNAQAAGDLQALQDYKRRTLRVHFSGNPTQGVAALLSQLRTVLAK